MLEKDPKAFWEFHTNAYDEINNWPKELKALIENMLKQDPEKRITIE